MGSERMIDRNTPLDFEERAAVERITAAVVNDPEGAAWTIVALQSFLAKHGLPVEVVLSHSPASPEGGNGK